MEQKQNFKKAFQELSKKDAPTVKLVITSRCKWKSPVTFYQKMRGERSILEGNFKDINEVAVIESTFKCYGIDAWTGEKLATA